MAKRRQEHEKAINTVGEAAQQDKSYSCENNKLRMRVSCYECEAFEGMPLIDKILRSNVSLPSYMISEMELIPHILR